jgi:hypothetical protein
MTVKQLIIDLSTQATEGVFHRARQVPDDKLTWRPLDEGRSVLNIAAECALSPLWGVEVVQNNGLQMTPEAMAEFEANVAALTTLDLAEEAARKNLAILVEFVQNLPEEKLDETIAMPIGRSKEWSVPDVLLLHYWNATYHVGQICYIQTLYGDKSMG